jgi:hypothetical protein
MSTQQSWQKLITQALTDACVSPSGGNKCSPVCIYEYIYRALNLAGINNRPPFGWYRIFSIWWQARGNAEQIKLLCIQAVQGMQKPDTGFKPDPRLAELLGLALLGAVLLPQIANTFINVPNQQSILHIKPRPIEDIDSIEISLPTTTDYSQAANQFLGKPVLFKRDHGLLGTDWISSQQDDSYSLQVISTSTLQAVFDFCKQHKICEQSAYYQSQIKGKTYFRLLYGNFKDHKAAQIAQTQLPAKLQQLKPWPRKLSQIKSEI